MAPTRGPVGRAGVGGDGVTLIEDVFDRPMDGLGEMDRGEGDIDLGREGEVVDTPSFGISRARWA